MRLTRPPRSGLVILPLLVLANVALFGLLLVRQQSMDPYQATAGLARTDPAANDAGQGAPRSPAPPASATPPVLAVYGDGYAVGNDLGGRGDAGWPSLLAAATGARLSLSAETRAGYVAKGISGHDFADLIGAKPVANAGVTVLFGSRNDAGEDAALVQTRATVVIAAARSAAPKTSVIVVGPLWTDAAPPATVRAARDAVKAAAERAGVLFVDPIADRWFVNHREFVAADGISATDAGHAYLASLLKPAVLPALAQSPAARGGN